MTMDTCTLCGKSRDDHKRPDSRCGYSAPKPGTPATSKQILWAKLRTTRALEVGFREEIFFETTIDLAELARLAHKAAKNRTGKAHHGAISVKILATRRGTNEDIQL